MGICYIVGAGEFHSDFVPGDCDLVIAADGGYTHLLKRGIRCDLLVGDMDSIDSPPHGIDVLRLPCEKDETDTYVCYLEGVRRGYTDFVVFGGVGGRDDHTFANYSLLIGAIYENHRIKLVARDFDIFAVRNEKFGLNCRIGATLSIFAYPTEARGVSIKGAKYELDGATLSPLFALGVSNEAICTSPTVEVTDGTLLIMLER